MRTQTLTKQMYTASLDRDRDFHFRVKDPGSAATHFIGFLAAVLMTPVLLVHASDCGADLMTMIGMFDQVRIFRMTSTPSMSGSPRSSSTMSGL